VGQLEALFRALDATPWAFSPWMVMEATVARDALRAFATIKKPG
jgi:isopentenyl-diphosphate delta-isomerase